MKFFYKRIIAVFLSVVIIFLSGIRITYAAEVVETILSIPGDIWTWMGQSSNMMLNAVSSVFNEDVCPKNPNILGGRHEFEKKVTRVDGKDGVFWICKFCNQNASDLCAEAYDNQVAELPATGITSAGRLIWQPTFADANANISGSSDNYFRVSYYEGSYPCTVYLNAIPNCEAITIFSDNTGFICAYSNSYFKSRFGFYFNPVIAGSYRQIESLCYSYSCLDQSGTSYSGSVNYSAGTAFLHYDASTVLSSVRSSVFNICPDLSASATVTFGTVQYHFPVYEIIPDSVVDTSAGGQYSVTTRPTSITGGNYGIIGDDGEITTITNNNQIINETNNTYYNPATGETKPILDWSYNYTDRSYKVTLESGDTYTITYGDENIVIKEHRCGEKQSKADPGGGGQYRGVSGLPGHGGVSAGERVYGGLRVLPGGGERGVSAVPDRKKDLRDENGQIIHRICGRRRGGGYRGQFFLRVPALPAGSGGCGVPGAEAPKAVGAVCRHRKRAVGASPVPHREEEIPRSVHDGGAEEPDRTA